MRPAHAFEGAAPPPLSSIMGIPFTAPEGRGTPVWWTPLDTRSLDLITRARFRRWMNASVTTRPAASTSVVCAGAPLRRGREPWVMAGGWLRCRACRKQTSLTAGTIFEGTRKPLRMWFLAMWFVTSQKNGVSALGLQRELGLGSYETACTSCMVRPGRDLLSGTIEVDETYVGGPEQGTRGRETESKAIVAIAVEKERPGAWPHPPSADRRCLDRQPAFLRPRRCGARGDGSHRRLEGLCRTGGGRLSASGHGPQRRLRPGARSHAARPPRRLAAQAMADRYSPGGASSINISTTTSTNSPSASIAADQRPAGCSFIASPNKPSPLDPRPTAAPRQRGNEGDTQFIHNGAPHGRWLAA